MMPGGFAEPRAPSGLTLGRIVHGRSYLARQDAVAFRPGRAQGLPWHPQHGSLGRRIRHPTQRRRGRRVIERYAAGRNVATSRICSISSLTVPPADGRGEGQEMPPRHPRDWTDDGMLVPRRMDGFSYWIFLISWCSFCVRPEPCERAAKGIIQRWCRSHRGCTGHRDRRRLWWCRTACRHNRSCRRRAGCHPWRPSC